MTDTRGLHHKFNVQRTDGSDQPGGKHDGCSYFVLDLTHDAAARSILPALADAYEAHGRPELARDLRSGVPVGGGEPQPTTSTDGECPCVDCDQPTGHPESPDPQTFVLARDRVEQVGPLTVRTAHDGSKHVVASKQVTVRSAGGGDQPDTPCPLCDDTGQYPPPGAGASTFPRPCPVCADKENTA